MTVRLVRALLGRLVARRRKVSYTVLVARAFGTTAVVAGLVVARRRWSTRPPTPRPTAPHPADVAVLEEEPEPIPEPPAQEPAPVFIATPRSRRRAVPAFTNFVVILTAGGLALGACFAAIIPGARMIGAAHHFTAEELKGDLSELSQRTTVYAVDGSRLGVLGLEDRDPIRFDEVPPLVIDAVIATEDQSFWDNPGIDVGSVFRALVTNASAGEIEQGGSTITQQLVKNRLFRANRDLDKKVRELVLAYRLNQEYSKEEILEEYLNTVYFGSGSYGIRSAAERFFVTTEPSFGAPRGKRLDELNLSEAALLAAVIANPEGDSPFTRPERAVERRRETLDAMADEGYITQVEADYAALAPLPTVVPPAELRPQTYFVEEVQQRLLDDPRLGATEAERLDRVLRGGLDVYTTLDPIAQFHAQTAVNSILPDAPPFTAALVAVEPSTGAVRALVGGPGFDELEYDIVTHAPGRQVGSAWKVITLAAALEAGYSPNDVIDGTSPCTIDNPAYGKYTTVNAEPSSGGVMNLRAATVGSVNCAYVRLFSSVGPPNVIDVAHRLGIQQQTLEPYLSVTLGTIEATPLEMATVGATIAAEGVRRDPYFVHQVVAPDGTVVVDESGRPGIPAISPAVAACEVDILQGVVTGGTGTRARLPGRAVAGKTGTTDNLADAWFLGFTPQLSATVWHGASSGAVPGAGFGGDIPARIWQAFMSAQLAGHPSAPFPRPGPECNQPGQLVFDFGRVHPWALAALFPPSPFPIGPPLPPGTPTVAGPVPATPPPVPPPP